MTASGNFTGSTGQQEQAIVDLVILFRKLNLTPDLYGSAAALTIAAVLMQTNATLTELLNHLRSHGGTARLEPPTAAGPFSLSGR